MKKVIVTQRLSKDKKTNEIRDALDIRLTRYLLSLKIFPILIANSFGEKSPIFIKRFVDEMKPHGLILTGGEDFGKNIPRDKVENLLLKYFTRKKKPILGICRGMQNLSLFFGSKLKKIKNHVNKKHHCQLPTNDKNFPKRIKCFHNYSINRCPKNFIVTVKSGDGSIESIKHNKYKWEGWMWHPERNYESSKILKKRIIKIFK